MEGWAKIRAAAKYAGISERTLRSWVKGGLRHVRLPSGTILIRYSWVDEFLESYEECNRLDRIVEEVMSGLEK